MTFCTTGVDSAIYKQLQTAMMKVDGLFNSLDENFRAWNIRHSNRADDDADVQELLNQYTPIVNLPEILKLLRKLNQRASPAGIDDEHDPPYSKKTIL